jgi:hypothetical protein
MTNRKRFSTLVGALILISVAVIAFGGVFAYQYYSMSSEPKQPTPPSVLNCDDLYVKIQKSLENLMGNNNYCAKDSDCIISYEVKTGLPCHCYELLNKNANLQNINASAQQITSDYVKNCIPAEARFNCPACMISNQNNVQCVNKKCIMSQATCVPNWQCGWGPCANGEQSMTAIDSNNCGLSPTGINIACPALARMCK